MALRALRAAVGVLLGVSGALLYAASWQRWAGACPWRGGGALCDIRQAHRYDFVLPGAGWEPVGDAAQLAGGSLLALAVAFALLPWGLTGRWPGVVSAVALVGAVLAQGAVGVATLRSGLSGSAVDPILGDLAVTVWFIVPPVLLVRFAFASRGWTVAAAVWLILATPLVATVYALGPYDARPWWEAISGVLIMTAGLCLLVAAALSDQDRTHAGDVTMASPTAVGGLRPPTSSEGAGAT